MEDYCKDNFVSKGMIADFCIHDKEDNPHCHVLLTMRPFKENGEWDAKSKKEYVLDDLGEKIKLPSGNWKSVKVDTTDWNSRENAELWRSNWGDICNKYLEKNNVAERIDHRSYERQGIDKIPSIHLGVSACQMEKKGIVSDRGNLNRAIAEDNKNLKVARARITRLMKWQREEKAKPLDLENANAKISIGSMLSVYNQTTSSSKYQKLKNLKDMSKVLVFLQQNNINDLDSFYNKIIELNKSFYALKGEIGDIKKKIVNVDLQIELWEEYEKFKPIRKKYNSLKGKAKEKFYDDNFGDIERIKELNEYWGNYKNNGGEISLNQWKYEKLELGREIGLCEWRMNDFKEELGGAEKVRKALEELATSVEDIHKNIDRNR